MEFRGVVRLSIESGQFKWVPEGLVDDNLHTISCKDSPGLGGGAIILHSDRRGGRQSVDLEGAP